MSALRAGPSVPLESPVAAVRVPDDDATGLARAGVWAGGLMAVLAICFIRVWRARLKNSRSSE